MTTNDLRVKLNSSERLFTEFSGKAYDILISNNGHMKDTGTDLADYMAGRFPESPLDDIDYCDIANEFVTNAAKAARRNGF